MTTAIIADDHDIILDGLVGHLRNLKIDVLKEATNGLEALEATITLKPDLLFVDLSMPEMSGEEVLEKLESIKSKTRVIVVTANNKASKALACLNSGASGFLVKSNLRKSLGQAVETVLRGNIFIDFSLRESVQKLQGIMGTDITQNNTSFENTSLSHLHALTRRELEVLQLWVIGITKREDLAGKLAIAVDTVDKHTKSIKLKLEAKNTIEAVQIARSLEIIK